VLLALNALRPRLPFTDPLKRGIGASDVVPLYARRNDAFASKDGWTIWNLCRLVAQRSELQDRFGDRARMENLLRDIRQNPHSPTVNISESIQIRSAMKAAGNFTPPRRTPSPWRPTAHKGRSLVEGH